MKKRAEEVEPTEVPFQARLLPRCCEEGVVSMRVPRAAKRRCGIPEVFIAEAKDVLVCYRKFMA